MRRPTSLSSWCFPFLVASFLNCGGDDGEHHGDSDAVPAAPTNLAAEPLEGGAHLTWMDNSDNETEFMIMRKIQDAAEYEVIASPTFDTTSYHDAEVTSATTYLYVVVAMNDAGHSEDSNEVEFTAP